MHSRLLTLMLALDLFCGEAFIRLCIRVTNPNVEKGRAFSGGSSPSDKGGGGRSPKQFFSALWASFWSKNKGGGPGSATGLATPKIHERECWAGHPLLCSYQLSALLRSSPEVLAQFGCQYIPSLEFRYFATTPSHAMNVDTHISRLAACNLNRRQSRGRFRLDLHTTTRVPGL